MKLKILHTNDVHSNFANFAKVATLIKQHKDEHTIVLEGGDFADFRSIELQGTRGIAAIELLENIGYDALTIGNNEMFNGVDTLEHMASSSSFPFISNNLFKKDKTKINGVHKSIILEKNGLRILVTGSSPNMDVFNDGLGIYMTDYKEAIIEEIKRNTGNYDICVLLSHVGTFADEPLAMEIPEIDIIISAHDHKLFDKAKVINNTIMNSAGNYGEHLGILELEINEGKVELINSSTISSTKATKDEQVISILKTNKEKAIEVLSEPLYNLPQPLWHDVIEENPMTNLIAEGLKDMLKCDIGLINSGICNAGIFHEMTRKKLIEICPSPLNPTSFEIQGKYIKEALEQSLDAQVCLADGRGPGFRGKFAGRLHIAGAQIVHDGKNVQAVYVNDMPLEEETWYAVASSDFLQRGSIYESLANNRNEKYLAEEIKDVIRLYADKEEFIEKAYVNRWKERAELEVLL
ncbi:bifunctional metallophosphatase/5'-nucleotidase [Psychrobacillus lasiicapitis]|uniref:Bifunctional metallophosphatase/5'-nucleotidase n=1 Tax=Psychrobacillus lasiicapitis TaxID=1636719 RepID=A0A544SWX2_9BACI|nr:5'-nucleotidase C-terminal domain-containing protein [Psychrobacillus lasiicapitis]TQR09710.1 bifunctional metallophosphatase/5'-nucleotidase [Psychrobacillus lasiicapitis]GGA22881.1 putative metallophosphoesterase YunD [Psychrobacillus lasiicapitis]